MLVAETDQKLSYLSTFIWDRKINTRYRLDFVSLVDYLGC